MTHSVMQRNIKVFCSTCALELQFCSNAKMKVDEIDYDSYILLILAPSVQASDLDKIKNYDWLGPKTLSMKLTDDEVMKLVSVFLRISDSLKMDGRKTKHRSIAAYKNIHVYRNSNKQDHNNQDGLLIKGGIYPVDVQSVHHKFEYMIPVPQMTVTRLGLFLLGYLSYKTPYVSSESLLTSLRLAHASTLR
ncbi:Uncharacterised protein [Yersinia intermedia]|nr:Uncharacterised protein [Yersinia intermedia]